MQLLHGYLHGLLVRLNNALVVADQGRNGNGFGRREGEIIEHAAIGVLLFRAVWPHLRPGGFQAQGEAFACLRMQIVAQALKLLPCG